MELNDFRGTGRTTRMLEAAAEAAKTQAVLILCANEHQRRDFKRKLTDILSEGGTSNAYIFGDMVVNDTTLRYLGHTIHFSLIKHHYQLADKVPGTFRGLKPTIFADHYAIEEVIHPLLGDWLKTVQLPTHPGYFELQKELDEARGLISVMRDHRDDAVKRCRAHEEQIRSQNTHLAEMQTVINERDQMRDSRNHKIEMVKALNNQVKELRQVLAEKDEEMGHLRGQVLYPTVSNHVFEKENLALKAQLEEVDRKNNDLCKQINTLQTALRERTNTQECYQAEVMRLRYALESIGQQCRIIE